jgi:RNA polymerase sigma factor (TIGR02999 family)
MRGFEGVYSGQPALILIVDWVVWMTASPQEVTQLLIDWSSGNQAALDKLMPLVYQELHRLAHQYKRREDPRNVLQTSALVNEAYLRLIDQKHVRWQNRAHFFAIAAQLMRRILVDYARKRDNTRRGGRAPQVTLDEGLIVLHQQAADVLALNDALQSLAAIDSRQSQLVELRFFGGLTIEETAEVLKVSPGTVMREWTFAKAWLQREMTG